LDQGVSLLCEKDDRAAANSLCRTARGTDEAYVAKERRDRYVGGAEWRAALEDWRPLLAGVLESLVALSGRIFSEELIDDSETFTMRKRLQSFRERESDYLWLAVWRSQGSWRSQIPLSAGERVIADVKQLEARMDQMEAEVHTDIPSAPPAHPPIS